MVKLPKTIYRQACNDWVNSHKFTDDKYAIPYHYMETKFRWEGYGKKKAFDWICELTELYNFELKGNYIKIPGQPFD